MVAFIFSVIPATRPGNIATYNRNVDTWSTIQPSLEDYVIMVENSVIGSPTYSTILTMDYSQGDKVPNTRPEDNFKTYQQTKWFASGGQLFFQNLPFMDGYRGNLIVTIRNKKTNSTGISTLSFVTAYRQSYCCVHDSKNRCLSYCYNYYKISRVCMVLDIEKLVATTDGCLGGFGSTGYWGASFGPGSFTTNTAIIELSARDKNDPYYTIPFIIGYGGGNTWGVTQTDNLVILIIFYILSGICCLGCSGCVLILGIQFYRARVQDRSQEIIYSNRDHSGFSDVPINDTDKEIPVEHRNQQPPPISTNPYIDNTSHQTSNTFEQPYVDNNQSNPYQINYTSPYNNEYQNNQNVTNELYKVGEVQ